MYFVYEQNVATQKPEQAVHKFMTLLVTEQT